MNVAKRIKYMMMAVLVLPAYLAAFKIGKPSANLTADMRVWKQRTPCPFSLSFWVFVYLMTDYPPFRNITYFRLKRENKGKFYRYLLSEQSDIYLACEETIGSGFYISHGYGTTINVRSIGENFHIYQGVTLGQKNGLVPIVGNNVTIYAGAKIIGGVTIGDNVVVGANAVVLRDIPANSVAVGVPATIKPIKTL